MGEGCLVIMDFDSFLTCLHEDGKIPTFCVGYFFYFCYYFWQTTQNIFSIIWLQISSVHVQLTYQFVYMIVIHWNVFRKHIGYNVIFLLVSSTLHDFMSIA